MLSAVPAWRLRGLILCETSPQCILARVRHEHSMGECRVVIREPGTQPEPFDCGLCGEACEGWDFMDCGTCEQPKHCHSCHREGRQMDHEANCWRRIADSVWIPDADGMEGMEERGKDGMLPCFECHKCEWFFSVEVVRSADEGQGWDSTKRPIAAQAALLPEQRSLSASSVGMSTPREFPSYRMVGIMSSTSSRTSCSSIPQQPAIGGWGRCGTAQPATPVSDRRQ